MDRGAWRATVHGVTKSQTQLKQLSTHEKVRSLRKGKRAELCNAQTLPGKLSTSSPELACHRAEWGRDQGMKVRAPRLATNLGNDTTRPIPQTQGLTLPSSPGAHLFSTSSWDHLTGLLSV